MYRILSSYYRPTSEQFKQRWNECLFVFDTNVLLDLYRYPEQTRKELLQTFHLIADRIWIPFQVALEYQENRLSVISEQVKRYDEVKKILRDMEKKLAEDMNRLQLKKRHSSINPSELLEGINGIVASFIQSVDTLREKQLDVNDDDKIRDEIDSLFDNKIGSPPSSQSALDGIYKIGDERYERKQPPGYEDKDKEGHFGYQELSIKRKFGDLILWFQLIEKAKESGVKHIIFVNNDEKEDWWWFDSTGQKTIGARRELVEEIRKEAGVLIFYMYNTEQFLRYAKDYFKAKVSEQSIEQVRDITESKIVDVENVVSFSQDEVFPIIREIIFDIYDEKQDFVTHDEITAALLSDSSGHSEVNLAHKVRPSETRERIASNMVAWFSQRITVGASVDKDLFDRKRIGGRWAYRPRQEIS